MTSLEDGGAARDGERIAIPGARAIDHAGFVVPNLDEAVAFFTETLGASIVWQLGPFSDGEMDMVAMFNAARGSASRMAMMRLGSNLKIELLEWTVSGGKERAQPLACDLGVGHFAIDVEDIEAAAAYLSDRGVQMLDGPMTNRTGPMAGEMLRYFLTPWGMPIELIQRPKMPS